MLDGAGAFERRLDGAALPCGAGAHPRERFVGGGDGSLDVPGLLALLGPRTQLVGLTHVSNVLGTINPVAQIAAETRARGIPLLVDGSQAVPHFPVDVQALGCDFYVFTGHKLFAPTGTGALWGRFDLLDAMSPVIGGGEMIESVSFDGTVYAPPPRRFEAGTPNIAGFVGLAAAIGANRVLIALCDQPALSAEHLHALLACDGCAATSYDGRPGVPAVVDAALWTHAATLRGDRGFAALLAQRNDVVRLAAPALFVDIDTPAQLAEARAHGLVD